MTKLFEQLAAGVRWVVLVYFGLLALGVFIAILAPLLSAELWLRSADAEVVSVEETCAVRVPSPSASSRDRQRYARRLVPCADLDDQVAAYGVGARPHRRTDSVTLRFVTFRGETVEAKLSPKALRRAVRPEVGQHLSIRYDPKSPHTKVSVGSDRIGTAHPAFFAIIAILMAIGWKLRAHLPSLSAWIRAKAAETQSRPSPVWGGASAPPAAKHARAVTKSGHVGVKRGAAAIAKPRRPVVERAGWF